MENLRPTPKDGAPPAPPGSLLPPSIPLKAPPLGKLLSLMPDGILGVVRDSVVLAVAVDVDFGRVLCGAAWGRLRWISLDEFRLHDAAIPGVVEE